MLYAGYDNLNPNYEAMRDRFQRGKCLKQAFEWKAIKRGRWAYLFKKQKLPMMWT